MVFFKVAFGVLLALFGIMSVVAGCVSRPRDGLSASPTVRPWTVYDLITMVEIAAPVSLVILYLAVLGGLGWLALRRIARFHRWLHRRP